MFFIDVADDFSGFPGVELKDKFLVFLIVDSDGSSFDFIFNYLFFST